MRNVQIYPTRHAQCGSMRQSPINQKHPKYIIDYLSQVYFTNYNIDDKFTANYNLTELFEISL